MKTIRDAVHGDMRFDADEIALLDTPTLQRLRGIKQLGASNLVYPSAVHSRFEHTLGTAWLTQRILAVLHAEEPIDVRDRQAVRFAALLHDVTHVPFGHTFEDERRLLPRHDEDADRLDTLLGRPGVAAVLERTGQAEAVRALLTGRTADWRGQVVWGAICADLLDYLRRDAYFTGLRLTYDDRILSYFARAGGRLVLRIHKDGRLRRDAVSELVHLLQIRYALTERVYYHHAKVVAGAMVSRALELALRAGAFDPDELLDLRDDSLLDRLWQCRDRVEGLQDVLADLRGRRLYRRAYFLTTADLGQPGLTAADRDGLCRRYHDDVDRRFAVEQDLADALGVPASHVIVYCPSPKMQLKEAAVPVEVGPGDVRPLSDLDHPDVAALQAKHRGLWRFVVCVRRGAGIGDERAARLCEDRFGFRDQSQPQDGLLFQGIL